MASRFPAADVLPGDFLVLCQVDFTPVLSLFWGQLSRRELAVAVWASTLDEEEMEQSRAKLATAGLSERGMEREWDATREWWMGVMGFVL